LIQTCIRFGPDLIVEAGTRFGGSACPWEAVVDWLPNHPEFVADRACEKFFLTFNPHGYLKRIA
jgi:cephalosporin hydroxylase